MYVANWLTSSTIADQSFKLEPTLADVPSFTDFTGLFDQYAIKGVSFELIPRFNVNDPGTSGSGPSQIMTTFDYDGNGPGSISGIVQYQQLKTTRGTQVHKRYLKPAILMMAYESGSSTAYVPKWRQYIDTADTTVPHYGIYGMVPQTTLAVSYDLKATYYISCKNVR